MNNKDINGIELTIAFYAFLVIANITIVLGSYLGLAWLGLAIIVWVIKNTK